MPISNTYKGLAFAFGAVCLIPVTYLITQEIDEHNENVRILADGIVKKSLQSCEINSSNPNTADYYNRLITPLKKIGLGNLETIIQSNITICLDARLPVAPSTEKLKQGEEVIGVFDPQEKVMTLWDTGQPDNPQHIINTSSEQRQALSNFSDLIEAKSRNNQTINDVHYAGLYKCGLAHVPQSCIRWKPENESNQLTIQQNPQLKTLPIQTP